MEKENKSILSRIIGFVSRRKLLSFVLLVVIVGIAIWRFGNFGAKKQQEKTTVQKGEVTNTLVLSGEVSATEYAQLSFPTSGKIAWVGVSEGDEVKKSQALTKLDTIVLNSAFQQARSALRAAEATVEKVHDQVKDHSADETYAQKDTRTTAEAAKDEAYEAYVAAEYNLRNATLVSPFSGIVTYLAHPFSQVNVLATETQVEVINPDTIYFEVTADQSEVVNLEVGQNATIVLDSLPNETLKGKIDFISFAPKGGEVGTVYKIKVKFDTNNFDTKKYRIGMGGDARIILSKKDDVLWLPPKFVKSDNKGRFVRKNAKNGKTYITVGIEGEDKVEISGDIKEGDIVYD